MLPYKCPQSKGAGAAVPTEVPTEETSPGAVVATPIEAETPIEAAADPTTGIKIIIVGKTLTMPTPNLTRRVPELLLTFQTVPVLVTGRWVVTRPTAVILLTAPGSTSLHLVKPEKSASLD